MQRFIDAIAGAESEAIVEERLRHLDLSQCISQEEIDKEFGFTPELLSKIEVEIE